MLDWRIAVAAILIWTLSISPGCELNSLGEGDIDVYGEPNPVEEVIAGEPQSDPPA